MKDDDFNDILEGVLVDIPNEKYNEYAEYLKKQQKKFEEVIRKRTKLPDTVN